MNALEAFGLSGEDLTAQVESVTYPKPVAGRVAHIDADFLAYQVTAESADELDGTKPRKAWEDMTHNAKNAADHLMRLAGATTYFCHLTPSASTKGGRPGQAIQQEYQANRKDVEKPEFLDRMRAYIATELNGVPHLDQEADDGMSIANYEAVGLRSVTENWNSVIVSRDKDLRMVPGLHYDFDKEELLFVNDPFGTIWLDDSKSTKKLTGWGTKFFWAQCLMGDTADHIKGIPAVAGKMVAEIDPPKSYTTAIQKIGTFKDGTKYTAEEREAKNQKVIDDFLGTPKNCGPSLAFEMLNSVTNDRDAFQLVRSAWTRLETEHGHEFKHWKTGKRATATQALLGDMQLLWMRRNKNPNDVLDWIKDVMA